MGNINIWSQTISGIINNNQIILDYDLLYKGKKPFEILKQVEGGRRLEQPMTCTIELYGILLECELLLYMQY